MRRHGSLARLILLAAALAGCAGAPLAPAADAPAGEAPADGDYDTSGRFSRTLREGPHALLPPVVARVPSPVDGADVQLAVVRPDVPEGTRVPVLVVASPYYAPLSPESIVADDVGPLSTYAQGMYVLFAKRFVPHGHAVALVAVRGTADSGGCMDFNGPAERADLDAAVTWLGRQEWSNGRVGMVGGSYDGTVQWEVASMGNPHLRTIVPIAAVTDLFSIIYRNGTVDGRGTGTALATYYGYGFVDNNPANGRSAEHVVSGAACESAWDGFLAHADAARTGERGPYWAARDLRPGVLERYRGSVLLVHGLSDRVVIPAQSHPFAQDLEARGVVVRQLLGQWGHAWPDAPDAGEPRWDWAETLLRWFDRWLKEENPAPPEGPRVEVQDTQGLWRREEAWPPPDARPVRFHLAEGGALAPAPSAQEGRVLLCPDLTDGLVEAPAALRNAACVPGAWFRTAPLEEELRFAGLPTLHVPVTPHGPGGHLVARLFAEDPDGGERLLARAQMDLRAARGDETPRPVEAGETLVARMQFEPTDAVVPEGARLVLVLRQGSLEERLPSVPTSPLDVRWGPADADDALGLEVRAFARGPGAFFEPPR